ncbi:unnamed protein product [Phytophthora lilii]|uniref:Unnamed protein product n=1 Tax=Phytophthora lilii TaxID=2077276 RepID=A0A9W7CRD0_9STRA|nr:unnamed protein product [Phytophthora lilii]
MNNSVSAALEHGTEDLVIVGDLRLAIQQSLGVMACRKESLLTLLNHHRALAAKFKSVRYLHVVCEYNAAADALASETLENKAPVNPSTSRQTDLAELNRIPEVIYEPSVDLSAETSPEAEATSPVTELSPMVNSGYGQIDRMRPRRRNFFDFVQEQSCHITAMTRSQAKEAKRKRVRFADETPETRPEAVKNREEALQDPSETSFQMLEENAAQDLTEDANSTIPPSATDIDPAEVQEERRQRLASSQDEELR